MAALTALLALSAACAQGPPARDSGGVPVPGGALTFAVDREPNCLDPHVSPADTTAVIDRNVFDSLVSQDAQGKFRPWLATAWRISPDLRTYTFDLRTDVRFHDGTPFDANAVKANLDHIADPATKSLYAVTLLGPYAGTTVIGAHTAEVRFSRPFAPFLQAVSTTFLGMASPAALKTFAGSLCDHLVGSGPFRYDQHVHQQSVTLHRNEDYRWAPSSADHAGPAYLEHLTFQFVPESATRIGKLVSGQVGAAAAIPAAAMATVRANPDLSVLSAPIQGMAESLYLNTSRAPFDDARVRVAFQRGIDLDTLIRSVYFGQYNRAWSPLAPATPAYDAGLDGSWGYDAAMANRLLDEAGWTTRDSYGYRTKQGVRLAVRWPYTELQASTEQRGILGQAIQAEARKLGIDLVRTSVQPGTLYGLVGNADYDLTDTSWTRADPDILRAFLAGDSIPPAGQNYARAHDALVDEKLAAAASTTDDQVRRNAYADAQRQAIRQAVVVPLYAPVYTLGAATSVHLKTFDPAGFPLFHDAWAGR
jgi:peptide/nickel transport system substrate-binding protein